MCEGRPGNKICELCGGEGRILIPHCPVKELDESVVDALELADWMKRGLLPEPGGILDQTESILQAIALIHREQAAWRKREGALDLSDLE